MRIALLARCLSVALLALPALSCQRPRVVEYEPGRFYFDWDETGRVSSDARIEFRRTFEQRVEILAAALREPDVVDALKKSNVASRKLSLQEILERDRRWQLAEGDEIIGELTDRECSAAIRRLARSFEGYAEILVTDLRGVNVCVTGRTTDYYQADEDWWQDANRSNKPISGRLEYDESAGEVGVPAYLPVFDPAVGTRIGAAKAIIRHRIQ